MQEPDLASVGIEEVMEAKDLPESDRDEVRRFAEFLKLRKQRREAKARGEEVPPWPQEWADYILGTEGKL